MTPDILTQLKGILPNPLSLFWALNITVQVPIGTNPPEGRRNKLFPWEARGWKTEMLNHQLPFPQDLRKLLLPPPSHYFPLQVFKYPPSTYQNVDLIKHFQTDSLNKHHGSLDTRGTHGHIFRNYLCSNTGIPIASAWAGTWGSLTRSSTLTLAGHPWSR